MLSNLLSRGAICQQPIDASDVRVVFSWMLRADMNRIPLRDENRADAIHDLERTILPLIHRHPNDPSSAARTRVRVRCNEMLAVVVFIRTSLAGNPLETTRADPKWRR